MPELPKTADSLGEPGWRERAERAERERDTLQHDRDRLQQERDRLQREAERLRQRVDHLKRQLDAARRAGFRQAAPFGKSLKTDPKRPGRRAGAAYGPKARRRVPRQIDEVHEARLPAQCPACRGPVVETGVAQQYQEELPVARVIVRRR